MKYTVIFLILFSIFVGNFVFAQSSDYTVGKVQFPDRCYSSVGTGTVIIIDPDMNANPEQIESIPIHLWSSRDTDVRTPNAIETGNDTGIFEATVFFNMYNEAFSQRIRVFEGDTLHAKYIDITVPYEIQQEIETFVVMGTLPPDQKWGKYWESLSLSNDSKYVYDTCMAEFIDKANPTDYALNNLDIIYPAPLKQIDSGLFANEIMCKDNLELILKYSGSPACVKPKSINILILRGWADEKFRTLPIIDFQNPDRIFREVGYLGLMMLLPHIEENQTITLSLEGKPNMILPIIQYYEIEILSEKTNTNESFSSVFGKITKPNLQKFFEENPMNIFVKRGVLLTSLGGYQDNTGTYGPFNQFLTDNKSQIIGDILTYYENKRTNEEDVHFSDFVKWPTGTINELFFQKLKLLDIASIEENRIVLNPTDTCAHISLRLLSTDKLEQYQARDKEIQFFEITETELQELPILDELIQATHHLEFTTNDDAHAEMSLREFVDYEFFIMEKAIDKYDDSQDDYFIKLDGNLDEKLADPKPQGFSNEFLSPQIVYNDNVYVLSHTVFWVANEHETQSMSVHLQNSIDNDKKFITLTDEDMGSIPKIKQAIEKIGTEFESIVAYKGLPENPDWNEYREWFGQKKTEQFNLDETYVPGFVYNDEYYDLGFPIC